MPTRNLTRKKSYQDISDQAVRIREMYMQNPTEANKRRMEAANAIEKRYLGNIDKLKSQSTLYKKAMELANSGNWKEAFAIGRKLGDRKYSQRTYMGKNGG